MFELTKKVVTVEDSDGREIFRKSQCFYFGEIRLSPYFGTEIFYGKNGDKNNK